MGNVMGTCSCVDLSQDRKFSNIKIHTSLPPMTHPLRMKNSESNVNMMDVNDVSVFSSNLQICEQMTNTNSKINFIEPYNSKNNFFYYLNKIIKLQKFYKERYKQKQQNKIVQIKTQKTIKKVFFADDIDNEGKEKIIESYKIVVGVDNPFNYEEFQNDISKIDFMNISAIAEGDSSFDKLYTPQMTLNSKYDDIPKKKTKDFVRAMVKRKTEFKKHHIPFPSQEGCSLTTYMTNCQASFRSAYKSTIINESHIGGVDSEPRGCFLKKKLKFKFEGNVNIETKKKEGFGKITWNDESILLVNFVNNRANDIAYYKDKPNCAEFSGYYIDNVPQGYGLFKSEGIITEGEWDKNNLTGIGREYSDKDTYYQGEYVNSVKNGIGIYRWSDGTMYKGEWDNNQMTGFGLILFNDDKLYFGQVNNGVMEGYGEFYWGRESKTYIGYYKNDLKHGFGIYISNQEEDLTYIGFWEKGKMHGVGLTIKAKVFRYGVWKKGTNEKWLQGPWELRKYVNSQHKDFKFIKILELTQSKISSFLCNFIIDKEIENK